MSLDARELAYHIGSCPIIESVNLSVNAGKCLAIIGPNGAGKTTLFKLLAGDIKPSQGAIFLQQRNIAELTPMSMARRRAVLPQFSSVQFSVPVDLIMRLAREAHDTGEQEDQRIIAECLHWVDAQHLAKRDYSTLSGGEKQRVQIARVLAQIWQGDDSRYLFLDEPLNMLDIAHQHLCLDAFRRMAGRNVGVIMILHDINLAMQYADEIAVLDKGKIIASGAADEVITDTLLKQVFRVRSEILNDSAGNRYIKVLGHS